MALPFYIKLDEFPENDPAENHHQQENQGVARPEDQRLVGGVRTEVTGIE